MSSGNSQARHRAIGLDDEVEQVLTAWQVEEALRIVAAARELVGRAASWVAVLNSS